MKVTRYLKENYKTINIIILCLCIYFLIFPIVSSILENVLIQSTKCPYLTLTGKPCPLCGGTRFIKNLPDSLIYENLFFIIVFFIIVTELLFRLANLIKKECSEKTVKIDFIIHILIFIIYTMYEIWFVI